MRNIVAGVAATLVVVAVVTAGWWLLEDGGPGDDAPGDTAAVTAEAYLEAWAAGAHTQMAQLVREPPEDFVETHDQFREALDPESLDVRLGEVTEPTDGRALAPVELVWDLDYADDVAWEVEIELLRERGEWGVAWEHASVHPDLQRGLLVDVQTTPVERGPILAADGTELAGPGDEVTFGFDPAAVEDTEELAEAFEEALPGTGDRAERELGRGDLVDGWFYPIATVRSERADDADATLRGVSGVLRRTGEGRALFTEEFGVHVVGRVAEATAEQLERLGPPYEAGDEVGQFGLEAAFETHLTGSDEVAVVLRDGEQGAIRETIAEFQADPSGPLETTLDVVVQRAVENALVDQEDEPVAVVVVDADDGAIRGAASRPTSGYNRAFEGAYAPGSAFKVVAAEAMLADGIEPDDEVDCPERARVGGLEISNADDLDLDSTTFARAFSDSCNTTFGPLAVGLGADALTEAAARFGFGVEPELGLSAVGGSFPEPGDDAELGAASFGQARVTASPLHLATVAAAAETGTWHQPHLVPDRPGPQGDDADETPQDGAESNEPDEQPTDDAEPPQRESRELADGVVEPLRDLLREAVEDGTGQDADVHPEVRGKTGTAEADGDLEHAWFIGSFEGLGFAVLVEEGGSGGEVAAPIAGRLVSELEVLLDDPDEARPDGAP